MQCEKYFNSFIVSLGFGMYISFFSTQCVYKSVILALKVHLAKVATYPVSYDAAFLFGQCLKFMSG